MNYLVESSIYEYSIISTCNETGPFCIVEIDRIRDAIDDKQRPEQAIYRR